MDVVLKPTISEDLEKLFEIQNDAKAAYSAAFVNRLYNDKSAYLSKWKTILDEGKYIVKSIFLNSHLVGSIGIYFIEGEPEITYWISRDYYGKGIASNALNLILKEFTIRPIFGRIAADNKASGRVLTKNGFKEIDIEVSYSWIRNEDLKEIIYRLD